ncbi:MAG: Gfo/Idh/MocA family protein [Pseudomonadales bacterium]
MADLRLGMIGAGEIASYTAAEVAKADDVVLSALADPNAARANELAAAHSVNEVYASATELLEQGNVEAVYIAVPNALHAPLALQCLAAGKHVLLDKPFALSTTEASAVVEAAEHAGRVLMLGMNTRFHANVQRARALQEQGTFGPIYHVKAQWRRRSGIPRIGSWFTHKASAGGGALLDIGVHMLDASLYILNNFEPLSVSGVVENRFGGRGLGDGQWGRSERSDRQFDVEDFATALIRLKGGVSISLDAAWAMHQRESEIREIDLFGENAGASVFAETLHQTPPEQFEHSESAFAAPLTYAHRSRVQNFVHCIAGREQPMVTANEALVVQRILDAIYQSSESGREVLL